MNPFALTVLSSGLALGTTITISSHHWVIAWIGLEINTLSILPIMTKTPHPRAIEAATKYFLTQASASAMILFSSTLNAWATGEWAIAGPTDPAPTILLSIAILMKLGVAPFHFWLPEVLQGVPMTTGLILLTWQKFAPMTLLIMLSPSLNTNLMLTLGLASVAIGGWGGINQTQIRKILAFSSISHLGWMVAVVSFSPQLALLNFFLYVLISSTLVLSLHTLNTKTILELSVAWSKNPVLTTMSLLTLLSLGGLPPFTGFLPKLLITEELIKQDLFLYSFAMLMLSLLSLFFYLRLTYILALTLAPHTSISMMAWVFPRKSMLAPLITLSLALLPVSPTIIALF